MSDAIMQKRFRVVGPDGIKREYTAGWLTFTDWGLLELLRPDPTPAEVDAGEVFGDMPFLVAAFPPGQWIRVERVEAASAG